MHGARPRIGVTRWEAVPGERIEDYWERLEAAGGEPVDLHHAVDGHPGVDALIITGGYDIDPARYGEARHEKVRNLDPERDGFELALLARAIERDIPVLGICRGHQLINVAFGGRLVQHVEDKTHWADYRRDGMPSGWHAVHLAPGTKLREIYGADAIEVNSRHHQAVTADGLAPSLTAAATAPDGLVEALESPSHRWLIGVQWHPERPERAHASFHEDSRRLFEALVEEAAKVTQS